MVTWKQTLVNVVLVRAEISGQQYRYPVKHILILNERKDGTI